MSFFFCEKKKIRPVKVDVLKKEEAENVKEMSKTVPKSAEILEPPRCY